MIGNSYEVVYRIPSAIPLTMKRLRLICKDMDAEELQLTRSNLPDDEQFKVCAGTICIIKAFQLNS